MSTDLTLIDGMTLKQVTGGYTRVMPCRWASERQRDWPLPDIEIDGTVTVATTS